MKLMTFKEVFVVSIILHSFFLASFVYFSFQSKSVPTGTVSVLNVHLAMTGVISKQQELSKWQPLESKYKHKNTTSVKKISASEKVRFFKQMKKVTHNANASKQHFLPSFKKRGHVNDLMILLHNLISRQQHYPKAALLLGQQGDIEVGFTLRENGQIKNIRILHSSNHPLLDNAALRAVQGISPVLNAVAYLHKEKQISVWVHFKYRK